MNVGVWNIQGMKSKHQELFTVLKNRNIHTLILSAMKKLGKGYKKNEILCTLLYWDPEK